MLLNEIIIISSSHPARQEWRRSMKVAHAEVVKVAALIFFFKSPAYWRDESLSLCWCGTAAPVGLSHQLLRWWWWWCLVCLCISSAKAAFSSAFGANREKAIVAREKKAIIWWINTATVTRLYCLLPFGFPAPSPGLHLRLRCSRPS